jgi:asparagine synthase (glutamine-hydrolysing)
MCGIVGLWTRQAGEADLRRTRVLAMRDALAHRGPDDAGCWMEGSIALGHRRLSILDLSPEGHQPMLSADGRFVISYNGEIFNYRDLQRSLAASGHRFRGHSDTEVLLAAISQWGLTEAIERSVGMFAFALWDRPERTLHLVRDRLGIKPLYVARTDKGDLLFASELKGIVAHPEFPRRLDLSAVAAYLRYTYIPSPLSIYRDAAKVPPGHLLTLTAPDGPWESQPYWSFEDVAEESRGSPFRGDEREAEDALDALVRNAVGLRMIADVPLGAFLSGGIDSSLVVAQMQAQTQSPVRTFTIGFAEAEFDESRFARAVARHLGTDHTELVVSPQEAQAAIPGLPETYDEPFADVSQIPTCLVSALARQHVTVSLSGDGGDELFAGYDRYPFARRAWWWRSHLPRPLRSVAVLALRAAARASRPSSIGQLLGSSAGPERLDKLGDLLQVGSAVELYRRLISTAHAPDALMLKPAAKNGTIEGLLAARSDMGFTDRMLMVDTKVYLPDDLLTKLDRASMAVGLEGRVPLLDHRLVEFAVRLPMRFKLRDGQGKWLLKRVLARYLPRRVFDRPKMGFEVPIGRWLAGPLREWGNELLDPARLAAGGVFDPTTVTGLWKACGTAPRRGAHLAWAVLMFEAWRRTWRAAL